MFIFFSPQPGNPLAHCVGRGLRSKPSNGRTRQCQSEKKLVERDVIMCFRCETCYYFLVGSVDLIVEEILCTVHRMKINTLTFKHLDNGDDGCNEELVDWRTMQNIAQLLALISAPTLYFCNYHLNICPLAIFCLCRIFPIDTFIKIFCPISISSALQLNFCSAHYTSIARIAPFLVVRAPFLVLSAATFRSRLNPLFGQRAGSFHIHLKLIKSWVNWPS